MNVGRHVTNVHTQRHVTLSLTQLHVHIKGVKKVRSTLHHRILIHLKGKLC